ncbi:CLUMA_CG020136, isoform A [Clunio marinus]|uniref:CLUMA_CG020136, isoform A n=1 Tax=Clunio marinus TaxID=568069 RepID=A0A1J1J3Y6_9DIPT|nr:CLUMA_CG020136, isoform A [Clunio marinus]
MTNYGHDLLEELWKEILEIHWRYLETEESMKKIDERKLLEGRLKEYISVVSHDRKFFLPETEHVLRKSITQMPNFSAFKGADGFESVSHYASNLFTKPWRKEYRVIKLYSGFYHHEIKSNLMDAEKLFIAMGYTLLPNQTLVLDGPICPDQVTNVSRDALTAYVECQIMKQISAELASMRLSASCIDIFNFRECHIGDSSQSIKGLAQIIQSRQNLMLRKDTFALAISAPPSHSSYSSHYNYQQLNPSHTVYNNHCSIHPFNHNKTLPISYYNSSSIYNVPCSMHNMSNNCVPNSVYCQPLQQHQLLPHSKSLDDYDGKVPLNGSTNHHRLSLDQNYKMNMHLSPFQQHQQQSVPPSLDCIDAISLNHPYNQPNARNPLPLNLSSNLGQNLKQEQYYANNPKLDPMLNINSQCSGAARSFSNDCYRQEMSPYDHSTANVAGYHRKLYEKSDSCSSSMPENELVSFGNESMTLKPKQNEVKLRSSLKKNSHCGISDYNDALEHEMNELRALQHTKNEMALNEMKSKDGIGNYHTWDYVFKNLEKDTRAKNKNMMGSYNEKINNHNLQLENLRISSTSNGTHASIKNALKNNEISHPTSEISENPSQSINHTLLVQTTKPRNKSFTTATETNNYEHKFSSSTEANGYPKYKSTLQPLIVVPPGEWSCRFCTFLNPNSKKICEMCSKSKDFYLDADKTSSTTATCV